MDIHWHQDPLQRVIEIRGEMDESFVSHLSRSVIDLGRRDLVIDLSECTISAAAYESLRHLEQRLGSRTLLVLAGTGSPETVLVQETPTPCSDAYVANRDGSISPSDRETEPQAGNRNLSSASPPFQTRRGG